ncbi:MAG: branched-chain amino acid ABC transporter substrate-binding protein [Austwickia sp.]|jgi:branched-chain amino acid transport system substrate-binding protein|nr:MAG: branched-chain amino acid ABC transporter substrate-binding protein [Austwickia sp.]
MKNSFVRAGVGVTVLATVVGLAGCGSRSETGSSATGGSGSGADKKAVIGLIAPLSGGLSAMGLGMKNSVDLAIKQANEAKTIPGWTLELDAKDDEGKPEPGKNAASAMASSDNVVGVVGTLNSSVAGPVQPVLNTANIAMISPANTNPSLTKGPDLTAPKRLYPNYFRTCTTDDVQGPFAAQYLIEKGITSVATIHDKKTYGQGLVDAFAKDFAAKGGKVVAAETINPDDANYSAAISKVKAAAPKAVYYGGEYPQAGPLSQQMKAAGLAVPLMGGDGIYDPQYIKLAGAQSTGDLATSVGAPIAKMAKGQEFLDAYKKGNYKEEPSAYGAYAYDAAKAIIEGLKVSLKDAKSAKEARKATIDAIGKASFDGVSGKVAFDQYGDSTTRTLTVYKVTDGAWKDDKTGEVAK